MATVRKTPDKKDVKKVVSKPAPISKKIPIKKVTAKTPSKRGRMAFLSGDDNQPGTTMTVSEYNNFIETGDRPSDNPSSGSSGGSPSGSDDSSVYGPPSPADPSAPWYDPNFSSDNGGYTPAPSPSPSPTPSSDPIHPGTTMTESQYQTWIETGNRPSDTPPPAVTTRADTPPSPTSPRPSSTPKMTPTPTTSCRSCANSSNCPSRSVPKWGRRTSCRRRRWAAVRAGSRGTRATRTSWSRTRRRTRSR
jgi:hypothetical protein